MKALLAILLICIFIMGCSTATDEPTAKQVTISTAIKTTEPSTSISQTTTTIQPASTTVTTTTLIPATTIVTTTAPPPTAPPTTLTPTTAGPPPPTAPTTTAAVVQSQLMILVNQTRATAGLATLQTDGNLTNEAVGWSKTMAINGGISHSNIARLLPLWRIVGENVGTGPTVATIYNALLASPGHLANIVNPAYQFGGMGVIDANGTLWITQLFAGN